MSIRGKTAVSVLACAAVAAIAGMALTFSAFTSTTKNEGNQFRAGTVILSDNDAEGTLFSMAGMKPGSAESKCITVKYDGSLDSLVRLYAATTSDSVSSSLAPYLNVKVTRGTFSGSAPAGFGCTGFQPDPADILSFGPGVVFNDTLDVYPDNYEDGLQDPRTWAQNDVAVYKVDVSLADVNAAQGKDATTSLLFEARDKDA